MIEDMKKSIQVGLVILTIVMVFGHTPLYAASVGMDGLPIDQGSTDNTSSNQGSTDNTSGDLGSTDNSSGKLDSPLKDGYDNVFDIFRAILSNVLLPIAAVIAVVALIYAGFQFVLALGKPEKLIQARRNFLYTLIGVLLLLGAAVFAEVIKNTICQVSDVASLCDSNT